ncbi:MAG: flippase [Deltaproteobacteria bacterium]|nr:flippase [Deltaproteobacteria bacterium]
MIQKSTISGQHRTLNNAVFNTLPWAVSSILGILVTPYIVNGFGVEAYGILSLVYAIVGNLSFLDLNLGQAVVKYVAEYKGEGSVSRVNEVIGTTIFLFLIIGITGGVALLLSADVILTRFLKIDSNLIPVARSAISIGAVGFLATLLLSAVTGTLNGLSRFDKTGGVTIVSSILVSLGSVLLVKFDFGIEWVVALNVATTLFGFVMLTYAAKRVLPGLSVKPVLVGKMTKTILRYGSYTLLSRLGYLINYQCDKILVGVFLGSSYVTFYTVPIMLAQRIMEAVSKLAYVTFPLFSELHGKKDLDHIRDLYLNASRIILLFATAIALPLLIFGNKFLAAWMGPDFERNTGLVVQISTSALYLISMTYVPSLVLNGLGHVKITGMFSVTSACLNLAFIYPFSSIMGVSGVAVSLLVSQIVMVPLFLIFANRCIVGCTIVKLLREVHVKPVALGVLLLTAARALPIDGIRNIFLLMGAMALTGILYFAVAICVGAFTHAEKQTAISFLKSFTRRACPGVNEGA